MRTLWRVLRRPLLYSFLILLMIGSAGLMLAPSWFRESILKLQFPVAIQAEAARFISQTTPEKQLAKLKSSWPARFDAKFYDQADDEISDEVSISQMIVVLDFSTREPWPSSALHELKKNLTMSPALSGNWYVTGMGQKLVFIPHEDGAKIWEPGQHYKVSLSESLRVKSQKRWFRFEPFELIFAVPACEVKLSHTIVSSETAPVRYQAVIHFSSPFRLSVTKIRNRISLSRLDRTQVAMAEVESGEGNDEIQVRSEFLEARELDQFIASLPGGDYMEGFVCQAPSQSERVPASDLAPKLSISKASLELDRPDSSFWPEPILALTFSQPVAQADVLEHLRVMGSQAWILKPHPTSRESGREHLFTILTDHYEDSQVRLYFTPGPWIQSGIDGEEALRFDRSLTMAKPTSLCPESETTIFEFKSEQLSLLACGNLETNPFLVTGLSVWKFPPKKDSPAIRIIGETSDGDDGVSSSVVCYNADKSRIFVAGLKTNEIFTDSEVPPFQGRGEREGYSCDLARFDCLPETFDLGQTCAHPLTTPTTN